MRRLRWMKILFIAVFYLFVVECTYPQINSTTSPTVNIVGTYQDLFYPVQHVLSLIQKGGATEDLQYDRSLALFQVVVDSPYRTEKYKSLLQQYDSLRKKGDHLEQKIIRSQTELKQRTLERYQNEPSSRRRNRYTHRAYYDTERERLNYQINQYRIQLNSIRNQEQGIYNQLLVEWQAIYENARKDESYLKKFLESYATRGIRKANQQNQMEARVKAREEQEKAISEWQARITFDYLSKYSTLKYRYENKEITFSEFEKEKNKLENDRIRKLQQSTMEGRDAYRDTMGLRTTQRNTIQPKSDF